MTQNMSLVMTLFFGFFTLQVPAGLTLYWVTSNLLQMLQQWSVTRFFVKKSPTPATAGAGAGGGTSNAAPVVVDGKATKVTTSGATKSAPASAGANGGGAAPRPAAGTSGTAGSSGAKASKPANRPKAKGK